HLGGGQRERRVAAAGQPLRGGRAPRRAEAGQSPLPAARHPRLPEARRPGEGRHLDPEPQSPEVAAVPGDLVRPLLQLDLAGRLPLRPRTGIRVARMTSAFSKSGSGFAPGMRSNKAPEMTRPLRSVLFLPASNPRAVEKARTLPCDAVVL